MKAETGKWLKYADENLKSGEILLARKLFNPCLQNIQQSVEKYLKAVLIELSEKLKKTHSINELSMILNQKGINVMLDEEECDLLDSIYLPSKYPFMIASPDFEPDQDICNRCIDIAKRIKKNILALKILK